MAHSGLQLAAVAATVICSSTGLAHEPGGHGPPQVAVDACASLKAGDSCSFTIDGRAIDGTCRAGPDGRAVACAPNGFPMGPPHRRGPPQAAMQACAQLKAGDTCSFSVDGQTLDGVCRAGPDGGAIACASKALPMGPPRAPPAEAISACASAKSGDACSFSIHGRALDGVCRAGPDGSSLACGPASMAPPPPPAVAFEACASLRAGDRCSFTLDSRAIDGVCRAAPDGAAIACAPSDMPPPPQH
jgi:hypothetical protein